MRIGCLRERPDGGTTILWRRRTTRAQARRDREWRDFVRDLTEPARQLSPAEDERLHAFLDSEAAGIAMSHRHDPPAERAA
jgi:hypothetical protein